MTKDQSVLLALQKSIGAEVSPPLQIEKTVGAAIVTHNSSNDIRNCILALCDEPNLTEVVVVDNGSSDDTMSILQGLARLTFNLTIESDPTNPGFAKSTNRAVSLLSTDYVLLLNPDTRVMPGAVNRMMTALRDSKVGIVGPDLRKLDGHRDAACARRLPTIRDSVLHAIPGLRRGSGYQVSRAEEVQAVCGACLMMSKEFWEHLEGLDEDFWMYGEDLDLCARTAASGKTIVFEPSAVVLHAKGGSSGRYRSWRVNWEFHRALWLYYRKHLSTGQTRTFTLFIGAAIFSSAIVVYCRNLAMSLLLRPLHG